MLTRIKTLQLNLTLLPALAISVCPSALAQETLNLGGYQPSVIQSEQEAFQLYQTLPSTSFKSGSGCFQRAHYWAFQLSQLDSIKSMKVFLFFTARYQREFDYDWLYHVAPLISVKQADGSITDKVFDPTFINAPSWMSEKDRKKFHGKPISVAAWTRYFIFPEAECPEVKNYEDYLNFQERYYCYIMKTPMFTYIPENFETETTPRTEWREGDLLQMKKAKK